MTRTHRLAWIFTAALVALFTPSPAAADLRATAFGGGTRINEKNQGTLGAAATFGGLIGVEFEVARVWLGTLAEVRAAKVDATLTSYMGNMVLRLPTGPVQPYASAGVGVVRVTGNVDVPFVGKAVSASGRDLGWNSGVGVYLFPSENFGFRADVRRFQTAEVSWENIAGIGNVALPKFNFFRATAGITLKF